MRVHAPMYLKQTGQHHVWEMYLHCGVASTHLVGICSRRRGRGKTSRLSRWIIQWFGDHRTFEVEN